jgi:hypothetical protein
MSEAKRDGNYVPTLLGVSSVDDVTPVPIYADPTTHRLLVDLPSGTGDVVGPASATDNAIVRFDGATGTLIQNSVVIIDDTTGAITGTQSVTIGVTGSATGTLLLKGTTSGTVTIQTAAAAGTYTLTLPTDDGTPNQLLQTNGSGVLTWATVSGTGDVVGPASSTDNAVARFDSTTGKLLQNSTVTIGDTGAIATTIANTSNVVGLTVTQNDTTNNPNGITVTNAGSGFELEAVNNRAGAAGAAVSLYHDSASPAVNDDVGTINFYGRDSAANKQLYGTVLVRIDDPTSTTEDAKFVFGTVLAGSTTYFLDMSPAGLIPRTNDQMALGSASLSYSDVFLASGGVVNFANGNATLTHSTGYITSNVPVLHPLGSVTDPGISFTGDTNTGIYSTGADSLSVTAGGTARVNVTTTAVTIRDNLSPTANDGAAIGTTALQWSDLFLAEGAVINFDNGDVTVTQTNNVLAVSGGDLQVATAGVGTNADSVPTLSSTNTLTNKRITKRVGTTTSSATPTINTDNYDMYTLTAQTVDITSFTTNLSGTPTDGQTLWIAITGTAARAITWGASFEASTVALPTTTVTTNRLDVGFVWNAATSKWRCVASA